MSLERLPALIKYTELRHRADFKHQIEREQHVGSISFQIIFPFKKTAATFPPSSSTQHPHLSPYFFSCLSTEVFWMKTT